MSSPAIRLALALTCLACGTGPSAATGARGLVLRGPIAPGPEPVGSASEAPFAALFHVLDRSGAEVAQFRSDGEGRFEVALAEGVYAVVPDESAPLLDPAAQRREVTVPGDGYAEVVLHFDTGLR